MPHSIDDGKEVFLLIGFQSLTIYNGATTSDYVIPHNKHSAQGCQGSMFPAMSLKHHKIAMSKIARISS